MTLNATISHSGISPLLTGGTPLVSSSRGNLLSSLYSRTSRSQLGSTSLFSATLASAQSSPSTSQPAAAASATLNNPAQPLRTSPLNQAATSRGATIASSSAGNTEAQALLCTPLGKINPLQASTMHLMEDAQGNLSKEYFLATSPAEYAHDARKMAQFSQLFGLKAAKILQGFGTVEGHYFTNYQPTQEQLGFFNDQGNRAWYSVTDITQMMPLDRLALGVDLSAYTQAGLLNLQRTVPDFKFYTSGSAPVNTNQINLGRA
jgi:hypothetical protein